MRSNVEWVFWGNHDPLWGVASHPGRERGGDNPWNDDDFYQTGRQDWQAFSSRWARFGLEPASCLEIGSGAGRLTKWLAGTFGQGHGIAASPGMGEYARQHVVDPNVTFHVTDGQKIPLPDASVSGVFSAHVFQHFESAQDAVPVFFEIARVLRPRGSLMIHLPLYLYPHPHSRLTRVVRRLYAGRKMLADKVAAWKRAKLQRNQNVPLMRGTFYDVHWLHRLLLDLGMAEVEVAMISSQPGGPLDPFVLARKRDADAPATREAGAR